MEKKSKIDWKKVKRVDTLINVKRLSVTDASAATGLHRKQIYRFLKYAQRPEYPH